MFMFTLLLVALAAANSIYLFTRFRTYDMQMRSVRMLVFSLCIMPDTFLSCQLTCYCRLKSPCRRRTRLPSPRRNGATFLTIPSSSLPQSDKTATAKPRSSEALVKSPSPSSSGHCA